MSLKYEPASEPQACGAISGASNAAASPEMNHAGESDEEGQHDAGRWRWEGACGASQRRGKRGGRGRLGGALLVTALLLCIPRAVECQVPPWRQPRGKS